MLLPFTGLSTLVSAEEQLSRVDQVTLLPTLLE
jgi:hypothetical protein